MFFALSGANMRIFNQNTIGFYRSENQLEDVLTMFTLTFGCALHANKFGIRSTKFEWPKKSNLATRNHIYSHLSQIHLYYEYFVLRIKKKTM